MICDYRTDLEALSIRRQEDVMTRWRFLLAVAAVAMLAVTPTRAGSAQAKAELEFFQLPSGNIGCMYDPVPPNPASLRCDIRSGLKPKLSRPPSCDLEWGDAVSLSPKGQTNLVCHGDTVIGNPGTTVLRYGTKWTRGPFTCTSRTTGLTCKNTVGHGFFLSVQSWRQF
jgi:hypothetical protein